MDKKRSILNVSIAIVTKIILLVFSLLLKRLLIQCVGNDANGVYALYTSIIGFLCVADLGIGTAINFAMYKPIVEGDSNKVSALYGLYKKYYCIIGLIILAGGLAVMPALPMLAKGYNNSFNLYLTFAVMLFSVVFEYFFSCKTSLINAYKNNYVTTLIGSFATIMRRIIQLHVLVCFKSFELYLVTKIVGSMIQWGLTELFINNNYKNITKTKVAVDIETKKYVAKHVKAMFMHKVGSVIVNSTDNIIISAMIGVAILGKYSNYLIIMTSMASILAMFFSPLTSVMGHLCAEGNIKEEKKYFYFMYFLNFAIGIVFYLGYYAVIKDFVGLVFGVEYIMDKSIPIIITINYFIQFMRSSVLLFRDATGSFYHDRWKPVVGGSINVLLSIILVKFMGLVGVIIATIIVNMIISHIVEPYVLFKHGFKGENPMGHFILNYVLIGVFVGCLFLLDFCMQTYDNMYMELIVNGLIAVGIALVPVVILFVFSKNNRSGLRNLFKRFVPTHSLVSKKANNILENGVNDTLLGVEDGKVTVKIHNSEDEDNEELEHSNE